MCTFSPVSLCMAALTLAKPPVMRKTNRKYSIVVLLESTEDETSLLVIPNSGFLSREKTFTNCLKIDFRGENFRELPQKHEIRKSFLPRKKPVTQKPLYLFH